MKDTMRTSPGKVAVKHKIAQTITTKKVGAMMVVDQKLSLTELEVVYDTDQTSAIKAKSGDLVYVYTNFLTQPWAKEVIHFEGQDIILVPDQMISLVKPASV